MKSNDWNPADGGAEALFVALPGLREISSRFFGGYSGRDVFPRGSLIQAVILFSVGKQPFKSTLPLAVKHSLDSTYVNKIDAHAERDHVSFRNWAGG